MTSPRSLSIQPRISRLSLWLLLAGSVLAASACSSASASSGQLTVMEDSARVVGGTQEQRDAALDEMKALDADLVRVPVQWRLIAPDGTSRTKPKVDLTDPEKYPDGAWAQTDAAVKGALDRGMKPWILITAPAPRWAVAKETSPGPGSYNPDPKLYGQFAEAVAKRYGDVEYWSIWNEPNLSLFLQPQFKNGIALSAIHYRLMYRAAYGSLVANGHRGDTILFGEILPRAPTPRRINGTVPPVTWLQEFFCLDEDNMPYTGALAKKHACTNYKPIKTSGFAYHPYTTPAGPLWDDSFMHNATIRHMPRIYAVLDAASRAKRLTAKKLKVYNSEFGFQSNPPDRKFVRIAKIPFFLNASEYMSVNDKRMATYSQYLIVDDTLTSAFQTGLRFKNLKKKAGVYEAFQLPMLVVKKAPGTVLVWGKLRDSAAASRKIEIQVKSGGKFSKVATASINPSTGYFKKTISIPDADSKVFRLRAGELVSRSSKPVAEPKMAP